MDDELTVSSDIGEAGHNTEEIEVVNEQQIDKYDEFIEVIDGKSLRITPETKGIDYYALLDNVLQSLDMARVAHELKKGVVFLAKIPVDWEDAFEKSEVQIMENSKTHKLWPSLVKVLDNGKQQVVSPLEIERQEVPDVESLHRLTEGAHNLALNAKLAQISSQIADVYQDVKLIEQGQEDDRIAKIVAGKNQICLALKDNDPVLLANGRSAISEGTNQILKSIETKAKQLKKIPSSWIGRAGRCTIKPDFLQIEEEKYGKLEDLFLLYLNGTKMLSASYIIEGKTELAKEVCEQAKEELSNIDFSNVSGLEMLFPKLKEDGFHNQVESIFDNVQQVFLDDAKKYEFLEIKITPDMLPDEETEEDDEDDTE